MEYTFEFFGSFGKSGYIKITDHKLLMNCSV